MTSPAENSDPAFEYVFEQEVRAARLERFHAFSDRLRALASQQPGFLDQSRRLVEQAGDTVRFETTLRFDTAAHCIDWLDHPERRRLINLEEEQSGFTFRGHGNWEGYSSWLSRRVTTEPPKWKVNLLVLLTLYPTAMLLTPALHAIFPGFRMPSLMLISNALCVAATSWALVPLVSRLTLPWLEGELSPGRRALTLAVLLAVLALLLIGFEAIPTTFWN